MDRDELLSNLGKRVRLLRKAKGLSQEGLADACNLDRTYIGGIERGERNVSLRNLQNVAAGLETSVSRLLEGVA